MFEDAYYTLDDMSFLQQDFIRYEDVKVTASNNGSGWNGTCLNKEEGDYMFVTFNLKTPGRQVIAGHNWGEGAVGIQTQENGKSVMPHEIVCRPALEEQGNDESDTCVTDWLVKYNAVGELATEDGQSLGHSVVHILRQLV
jgi:hypothetical protein